jgi:hypothetical protein
VLGELVAETVMDVDGETVFEELDGTGASGLTINLGFAEFAKL